MEQKETTSPVAQPVDEEIKKHGDQLAKQVRDAANGSPEQNSGERGKEKSED